MTRSFHNKILRVNLSTGETTVWEPGLSYLRRYMGGWNIIADTLLREVPKNADPLGPENKLIVAPGVLTGLAVSGASRNAVGAKSPLTGGFGAGEVGGYFGPELKHAGFDAIIVEGVSAKPVYLWIKDGEVEIRDASHLWGQETKETQNAIREELDDKRAQCMLIGPGGVLDDRTSVEADCVIHVCGPLDVAAVRRRGWRLVPDEPAPPGRMSFTTAHAGPRPVIALHTAGLKVGEAYLREDRETLEKLALPLRG